MPPRIAVRDISFFERPVPFAKPFRFGAVVINASAQVFVRVEIEVEGKGVAIGASAELMAPKWFDKRAHLSPQQTVDGVAPLAADRARALSGAIRLRHRVRHCMPPCIARAGRGLRQGGHPAARGRLMARPKSTRRFWMRCCARLGMNFFDGMADNIAGIDARLSPDLGDDDIAQFLRGAPAAGARRDPAHRRHGRSGRRRGRRRRHQGKLRRALFQAQAQRRSRSRRGAADPDRQRTCHAAA